MPAPKKIHELVERFERNAKVYRSSNYNETQVRREFIDPLFAALGWDIDNRQGYAEAYKDVVHEDRIRVGSAMKAPDYSFRVGGSRKFFVEAKKPAVQIKDDAGSAFQLRRYAWSAKLSLSILTNFDEFAVYDCRYRPTMNDAASTARILYLSSSSYLKKWDDVLDTFSRESVYKGIFDQYAADTKKKRGTAEVDESFLSEIEGWREELAKNIVYHNKGISERELNDSVQRTIDRIVFLRMCEDRGIEPYKQLHGLVGKDDVYTELLDLYRRSDERYNSGLFHFRHEKGRSGTPDTLTPSLKISSKLLKKIFRSLYYPESPYQFSVLPMDILGHVYEQFLGKVIRITGRRKVVVEEKPEIRKAGGVYYTPTHIVEHVVGETLGKALASKTPRQAANIRILDPACGSGSFLLNAFNYLLEWHLKAYQEKASKSYQQRVYQTDGGVWRLTTKEKKRILINNIFGVDIDPQAVEVTKLSLLLKVLEGESDETLSRQLKLFHERALPDLSDNIKCGNSIVGADIYADEDFEEDVDADSMFTLNVFDWEAEFPQQRQGFDVVLGNPPWGQKGIMEATEVKEYVRRTYPSSVGIYDLFRPFVEKGIRLVKQRGYFGMVLPDIVLLKNYEETRKLILSNLTISSIDWWGMAFPKVVIDAATINGVRKKCPSKHKVRVHVRDSLSPLEHEILQRDFSENPRHVLNLFMTPERRRIVTRMEAFPTLDEYYEAHEGVHSGNMRKELFVDEFEDDSCKKLYFGRDEISPYHLSWNGRYIRVSATGLKGRMKGKKKLYANLGRAEWYTQDKLLVRRTGDYVLAARDEAAFYASNNFFVVLRRNDSSLSLDGLCALMNSPFMTWYFRTVEPRKGRVFAELKIKHINTFPLPKSVSERKGCSELNKLGKRRRELAAKLANAKTKHHNDVYRRRCAALNKKIHDLVCSLYELSDEEKALVE